jgi:DNA-binding GntR family transcriptional regulator
MKKPRRNDGLAGEAYVVLRERILRGEFMIGQVISRRKLASELGMSFLPVTDAMLRLENEGLLESRPRAGTRVRVPSAEDVRGHYVVREALEVQAAKLFAVTATAEERTELIKLAARVDHLGSHPEGDRFYYLKLHETLHRRISECARCQSLTDAIEKTHALSSTWRCGGHIATSDRPRRAHQELLEVLVQRDPAGAGDAMSRHIQGALQNALRRLEPYFQMSEKIGDTYSRSAKKQREMESLRIPLGVEQVLSSPNGSQPT